MKFFIKISKFAKMDFTAGSGEKFGLQRFLRFRIGELGFRVTKICCHNKLPLVAVSLKSCQIFVFDYHQNQIVLALDLTQIIRRTNYTPVDLVFDDKNLIPEYSISFKDPKIETEDLIEKYRIEGNGKELSRC